MRVTVAIVLAGLVVLLGPTPAYADGGSGGETVNVVIPSTTAPPSDTSSGPGSGSGGLAFTGAYLLGPAAGAAVLIALGVGLTVTARRRRHQ
ncbi:MAG TPA: hypothetical protein VGL06_15120 [Pseudonocardiaceae bacterium]